jgi:uncharacterized damage-inducible protein DinB
MTDRMSVAELSALIRATSTRMELLLSQLSVAEINQPGAVGVWSVKDVLAHIAFWERYSVNILRAVARGETPDLLADDETERRNASVVAQYYQRSLAAVIADWQQAREDLLEALEDLDDADLNDPDRFPWSAGRTLLDRITGNSFDHEQEHIEQIRAWMKTVTSDQ